LALEAPLLEVISIQQYFTIQITVKSGHGVNISDIKANRACGIANNSYKCVTLTLRIPFALAPVLKNRDYV